MPCSACGSEKVIARGLCRGCYHRLRRNGSVARRYVVNSGKCSIDGCEKHAFSKNLCLTHYNKAQHPIRNTWKLIRSRYPGQYPHSWDRFDRFHADVGERPTQRHQLRRVDPSKPYSKSNIKWVEPVGLDRRRGRWSECQIADYDRAWNLSRKYGISVEEYAELLAKQNGVCAICGEKESHVHKSGKLKDLAVDHCHNSKKVRGLLCFNCNQGLGRFQDSIERLQRAAEYLRKE